jgi:N-acylneuraminate cytidylyltransferase
MANLAIIPARGGSKRIPRKNINNFLGKPIIAYSIEAAISSGLFDEIMVSTDDIEIAEIASKYGAKVPFYRSKENSSDVATTYEVLEEVLVQYKKMGFEFEYVCCIYPCAPFITVNILNDAFWKLKNQSYDLVMPIAQFSRPIQRAIRIVDDKIKFINPQYMTFRSQDFEKKYYDSGQFYFFRPNVILESGKIIVENSSFIILNNNVVEDIDTVEDWKNAEKKYEFFLKSNN